MFKNILGLHIYNLFIDIILYKYIHFNLLYFREKLN